MDVMRLTHPVQVKVTPGERRTWKAAARRERQTLSDFVRGLVRERLGQGEVRAEAGCGRAASDSTR